MSDVRETGFKERTRVAEARSRVLDTPPIDRTESRSLSVADGRVVAEAVVADRNVPHYARAAMDGWAVRAEDTFGAAERSPALLRPAESAGPETAVRVHTGSELPDGADAVVKVEQTETVGSDLEVFDAVAAGENVAPVGEDVEAGQRLYDPGHRLRPSDLGLLKAAGLDTVDVVAEPEVAVIPTGEELVQADPAPGEVVETNRLTVSKLADRWGADVTRRNVVTDDRETLRAAVERDLTRDVVVTTGGSSVGERDLVPEVVGELGEILVHGVALKPGHPVALGRVNDVTVVMLPGYPVAAIVNAVQFLRPLVKHLGRMPLEPLPTREATLTRKIRSEPGVRTFARVELDDGDAGPEATPTRASGAGVLSSVALADGWVAVDESREGIPEGETVAVERWEQGS
jgi:molybdopterin molybdotransferase